MEQSWRHWPQVFIKSKPWRVWLLTGLVGLVAGGLGFLVYARNYTVSRQLEYPPCQLDYGQTVASWQGSGDSAWDNRNYYYIAKRFSIRSSLSAGIWANVRENPPSRLAAGSDCGQPADLLVDTSSDGYRWEGARADNVRLGMPNLGATNNSGKITWDSLKSRLPENSNHEVFDFSDDRAAAWVDDGGQASLKTAGVSKPKLLWCQNYQTDKLANHCQDIAEAQPIQFGAGYLFTADNCPANRGVDCQQAAKWYQTAAGGEFGSLIGTNARGEIKPFSLYLNAISTYGYGVGTGMVATFKYPRLTDITSSLSINKKTVKPGDVIEATLRLGKIGPNLSQLKSNTKLDGQPLTTAQDFELTPKSLAQLNKSEETTLKASYKVTGTAKAGQCYNLTVEFTAASQIEVDGSQKVPVPELSAKYCIALPQASFVYTYHVEVRGSIQSNLGEFKTQAAQTLASAIGWEKAGVGFKAVVSGGDFTLVLSSPDQMTSFSSGCDATYSCRAGRYVIINDERWRTATSSWNQAGGSLRDYRHMVINHEVGHWLGFGHLNCASSGAPAPVMQQQSISLQGCTFNPWPTTPEITSLKAKL